MNTNMSSSEGPTLIAALRRIRAEADRALAVLDRGGEGEAPDEHAEWVAFLGPLLDAHAQLIAGEGRCLLSDSLRIRRAHYASHNLDVRGSAGLFKGPGRQGVLRRVAQHGAPINYEDDLVEVTDYGLRLLGEWRRGH